MQVKINVDNDTMSTLRDEGYRLYGFKAVSSGIKSGKPTVWFSLEKFLRETKLIWEENYKAYISTQKNVAEGTIIQSEDNLAIKPGQTLHVDKNGKLDVDTVGKPKAISIQNDGAEQYTCGILQKNPDTGEYTTLCAFPLHGNMMDVIQPIEKVFLMFATNQKQTATVIEQSFASGLLINLTDQNPPDVEVKFDINTSWDWNKKGWGEAYPPNSSLNTLLIGFDRNMI